MKQRLAIRSPFPSDLQIPDWQRSWQRRAISPRLTREDARALELPAACPEALMRVHGFTIPLKLARGGLVRVMPVRVNGLEFARLKISDAGRAALTAPKPFRIDKVSGMSRKIEGGEPCPM